ncbi:MAG TPA: SIS domain-containing protein [Candidatus Eremiobacteraceae bacterium]|nr:SIS domain-containing protein [Candidatus Eremiobacteraceae bacterium]
MSEIPDVNGYFHHLSRTIDKLPFGIINQIAETVLRAYENDQMIYIFGNGGSAALASHLACDLGKGTVNGNGKRLRVLALTDNVPLMTAWANDSKYEDIFAEQLANLIGRDDIAFAISGSGNSPNILRALKVARGAGAITVGLTGFQGGKMRELCDQCMIVPCDNMQIIEDLHLCAAHALFTVIRRRISRCAETIAAAACD